MVADKKIIKLNNVVKTFDNINNAVNNVNLYIRKGEFLTILGPSGCGKTTLLRMIAGFEKASSGEILLNDEDITQIPPYKRPINTVFQKYALFPHLNVFDNIAFGLRMKKIPDVKIKKGKETEILRHYTKDEIKAKVKTVLKMVDLTDYEKRDVSSLSGGQQQRVAIARALVNEPEVLLLDEPLGALDLKMRQDMQIELKKMHDKLGITFIYVTHDQEEALTMSDTIVVMKKGEIQQIGTPLMIYNEPKNAFVADFIGDSNIFSGFMLEDFKAEFAGGIFECVDSGFKKHQPVDVMVRPEDVYIVDPEKGMLTGKVISNVFKGVHYEMTVKCGDYEIVIQDTNSYEEGREIGIYIKPDDIQIMEKQYVVNEIPAEFYDYGVIDIFGGKFDCDTNPLFDSELFNEEGKPVDSEDNLISYDNTAFKAVVEFSGIELTDHDDETPLGGKIVDILFKSNHYQVTVRLDNGFDLIVDTQDIWDDGDRVGITIPKENIRLVKEEEEL